eukprot:TRINITY_DN817_c0_g1_i1.p1 TRINITY_DN817_c0_g1~~TRINITY_DN817_c0_g1_i1.p1  ORF type:complete len:194 (+),score=53.62 TRINITY_DN817_c0_g1_i1:30-611(+)
MAFVLPKLPFDFDALAPKISKETLEFHYTKHHAGYVTKLNDLAKGTDLEKKSLEEIIKTQTGKAQSLAGQIWNHTFYWNALHPKGGGKPSGKIAEAIDKSFGSFDAFKKEFDDAATTHFGSGWAWLVRDDNNKLSVTSTHDGGNPLSEGKTPVLTIDVWEHAYYIDYRHDRASYVKAWWELVNWEWATQQLKH